jgi:indole-3-glycerol phosphate synthase
MPEARHESRKRELPSILNTILADKAVRLAAAKRLVPEKELARRCRDLPPTMDFRSALEQPEEAPRSPVPPTGAGQTCSEASAARRTGAGRTDAITHHAVAIIAEFKRRSPSRGIIRPHIDLGTVHRFYREGGAAAYSVLTEEDHFDGTLEDLKELRRLAEAPLLRKDFLFDPYQIYESRAAGADCLLLIVAALPDQRLQELVVLSRELGVEALVEVHTAEELERALACGARIVGINNRDLHSFEVDLEVSLQLARGLPAGITAVSESGIHGPVDIRRLSQAGIRAFLVGEHLLRSEDPAAALLRLKEGA